jgi:hypothetical protein
MTSPTVEREDPLFIAVMMARFVRTTGVLNAYGVISSQDGITVHADIDNVWIEDGEAKTALKLPICYAADMATEMD